MANNPVAGEKPPEGKIIRSNSVASISPRHSGTNGHIYPVFLADADWQELAAKRNFRLPRNTEPATSGKIEKWLRKLSLDRTWFLEWSGMQSLSQWQRVNPTWGLRALVGAILEELEP